MRFYRLHRYHVENGSAGYEYFTNERDATKARAEWYGNFEEEERVTNCEGSEYEIIEVEPTKVGILKALNRWASHNDNG